MYLVNTLIKAVLVAGAVYGFILLLVDVILPFFSR